MRLASAVVDSDEASTGGASTGAGSGATSSLKTGCAISAGAWNMIVCSVTDSCSWVWDGALSSSTNTGSEAADDSAATGDSTSMVGSTAGRPSASMTGG